MKKVLCLYSTREGQTKKIVEYIVERLEGYQCEYVDLHQFPTLDLALYDKVLVAASIRYGRLHKALYQFIESHHHQLDKSKAAFICINLTARKEEQNKDTPEGSVYVQTFLRKSFWQPEMIGVFAGALRYPRYRFFDRIMIRFIMMMTGGETDTSKEVEYTNWDKVKKFAKKFRDM
ncbi:menaquinone-dependent protoporphyrinogen IX dehydrogenase [Vibrio mangrovi]|uniref:Protoporphyrinogen IX dehydrogenase [quinone] n=1 Tax=Vibrio mangrovi TaxID=474394 RepID=A0A1Y6IYB6_9VIBR|nr:menaquinone-dependent protoporphyrinogen IX dehydrogenase [Vibrio mangrovi]MDW6002438.1 menaquinone-dependent protoporphyrinogen IX dehydrogenase [Vibrio mangrovi]SMS02665.1 Protoporphyrinogen IX dehydrogenase [menaquinone] [Vibrio mangrovi]